MEPTIVKKFILLTLFVGAWIGSMAQERLTDIHNSLHTHFETGYEWDGTKYLVSMLSTGDVKIFQLKGPEDARLIFEKKMPGVALLAESTRFFGEWMIFQDGSHIHSLHLTQKKLYSFEKPEGFYAYAESLFYDHDYCLLKMDEKSTGFKLYFIFDYDKGIERWDGALGTPLCRNGHEFVCHSFEAFPNEASSRFEAVNIKTGEEKLIVKNLNYQPSFHYADGKFWFVDKGIPHSFDPLDKSIQKYPAAKLSFYSTTSVYVKDDYLIVMGSQIDDYHVVTYDLKKSALLSSSKGRAPAAGFMTSKVRLFKQYLLCFDAGYNMHQFDYEKGFVRKYKVVFDPYFISDRVPTIHEGEDYLYNGKGYTYINFATRDTSFVPIMAPVLTPVTYDFSTFHFDDGRVLAITMSRHLRSSVQFVIDPNLQKAAPVNLTQVPNGMNQDSKIFKVDSTLYLWSNGLYRITEAEVQYLPSQADGFGYSFNRVNNKSYQYKVRNHRVETYALENDQLIIYQHKNDVTTRCGQLPYSTSIYEACFFNNKLYTIESKNGFQICQYDSNGSNRKVLDLNFYGRSFTDMQNLFEYEYLMESDDGVLYQRDTLIYKINKNGETQLVEGSPVFKSNALTLENNGTRYFYSNSSQQPLVMLQGDRWETIHQNIYYVRYAYQDEKRGKTAFSFNDVNGSTILLAGKKTIKKWTTPVIALQIGIEGKYILYRIGKDQVAYLLDLEDENLIQIPALPDGFFYAGLTITQKDTLVFGTLGSGFDYLLKSYRLSHSFTQIDELDEYPISAPVNYIFSEGDGESRLVYTSLFTGQIKGSTQLELLPDLILGTNITTPVHYANDHFVTHGYHYFLGADGVKGRQLYRWAMEYPASSTPDIQHEKAIIYPNPGQDLISIQHPNITMMDAKCRIYQTTGALVSEKPCSGELDIRDLNPGYYLGALVSDGLVVPFSFIKL